uniref:Putative peritrophic membrane protein 4 holotrichia oblita n=1 Tax=Xenopsylla cheopis TaxID=163159 RepID=A0A6M2DWS2_XENCH
MTALIYTTIVSLMLGQASVNALSLQCPQQDSVVDVLYANPDDCNSYYQCLNGSPVLLSCPNGLQWNDDVKLCDYPLSEGCKESLPKSPRASSTDFIPDSIIERCKRSPEGTMLADPEDCANFYVCSFGEPYSKSCDHGLLYHDSLKTCDWPENVDCCENGGETPEDDETPGTTEKVVDPDIPTECSQGVDYIPNFEDCTSYYQCEDAKPIEHSCPDGLYWNQDLEQCDFAENTVCYVLH